MGNRGWIFLTMIVLATSAARNGAPTQSKAERSAEAQKLVKAAAKGEKKVELPDDNPFLFLCERFNQSDSIRPAKSAGNREPGLIAPNCAAGRWLNPPTGKTIDYIVATVPDPERTHLTLFFDRMVESIRRAVEASGYDSDVHWLPWHQAEEIVKEQEEKKPDEARNIRQAAAERTRWPGLLLFHKSDVANRYLAVFLVGETPVSGIDATQLGNIAAYFRKQKTEWGMVGPTFSGSGDLLDMAVKGADFERAPRITISGTATHLHEKRFSVIHSDHFTEAALMNSLGDDPKLAWISESDTVYGNLEESKDTPRRDTLRLRFPRNIALLRNAYDESSQPAAEKTPASAMPSLALRMKDAAGGRDSIPAYSRSQTPVAQDTVLSEIAATLRLEKIRSAVIVATDVLDNLFVMRYLRAACPDVRLYSMYSDLLLVRPDGQGSLNGSMAVSTYPLFPGNHQWTWSETGQVPHPRRVFDSQVSQGTYNATLGVLQQLQLGGRDIPPAEYVPPFTEPQESQPPVWLTIAGRSGYHPVALLDRSTPDAAMWKFSALDGHSQQERRTPFEGRPRGWTLLYLALVGTAGLWVMAVLASRHSEWRPIVDLRPTIQGWRCAADRQCYVALTLFTFAAFIATLATAPLRFWIANSGDWWWLATLGALAFAALAGTGVWVLLKLSASTPADPNESVRGSYTMAAAGLAGLGLFVYVWVRIALQQDASMRGYFFAHRSLTLLEGVSPALPFLLLLPAYFAWAWTSLRRHVFRAERRVNLPGDVRGVPSPDRTLAPVAELSRFARENIDAAIGCHGRRSKLTMTTAFCLPAAGMLLLAGRYFRSVESGLFDALFAVALAIITGLVFSSWCQFLLIWARLRRWLEQLELHPLRHAFTFLPTDKSWSPLWAPQVGKRSHTVTVRSIGTLRYLVSLCDESDSLTRQLKLDIEELEGHAHVFLTDAALGNREHQVNLDKALSLLASIAGLLQWFVRSDWAKGEYESSRKLRTYEDWKEIFRADKTRLPFVLANEFIALRYLGYIRYAMLHMRNLLSFTSTGFILIVLSLSSYPFLSQHLIGWTIAGMFAMLTARIAIVFAQMDRDPTLSRITETEAGKVGKDFYIRIFSFGALPVLTVISTYFPPIGRFISSLAQPAMEALK